MLLLCSANTTKQRFKYVGISQDMTSFQLTPKKKYRNFYFSGFKFSCLSLSVTQCRCFFSAYRVLHIRFYVKVQALHGYTSVQHVPFLSHMGRRAASLVDWFYESG